MITHVFFDLDRTLWDFEANTKKALVELYAQFNLARLTSSPVEDFVQYYRTYNNTYWRLYLQKKITREEVRLKRFELTLKRMKVKEVNLADDINKAYIENAPYQKQLFPGTIETLKWLRLNGFQLGVITNGFKEAQEIKLKNSDIAQFFKHVVTSDCMGESKPHPKIFSYTLQLFDAKPNQVLMVGDDINTDILGAEQVGIQSVLFDPENKFRVRNDILKINRLNELKNLVIGL